ncbi:hypothetical protein F2P79_019575 [Pimephales promelas]|nr:hypothetical protein F2P79_019575 [Pimephales promelas]
MDATAPQNATRHPSPFTDFVCQGQDNVEQPSGEMIANEQDQITLLCNYATTATNAYLYWYKQLSNRSPTFILSEFSFGKGTTEDKFKKRFSATLNSTSKTVPLTIQDDVSVSDSAVYYCALATTVTGNTSTLYKNLSQPKQLIWILDPEYLSHVTYENEIKPTETEEFAVEGSSVTLSCSYSSAYILHWYRQYPGSAPEFLVLILDSAKEAKKSYVDSRFTSEIRKEQQSHVNLEISSATLKDSAVYYCALEPTVTGNTRTLYKNLTQLKGIYAFYLTD